MNASISLLFNLQYNNDLPKDLIKELLTFNSKNGFIYFF